MGLNGLLHFVQPRLYEAVKAAYQAALPKHHSDDGQAAANMDGVVAK